MAKLQGEVDRSPVLEGKVTTSVSPNGQVAKVDVPVAGNGTDGPSTRALHELRDRAVPSAFGGIQGVQADVSGMTASTADFNSVLGSHVVYVFAFVLGAAFLLLLFTFRSIVIPFKAIVLNLLSVGAAYGVLVLVFQHGWGKGLLGFDTTGAITSWLPLFLFVVLFGLSMDYHVFILSRVREAFDSGMSTDQAVARGIKSTAGVVTSAAVVMIGVFSVFGTLSRHRVQADGRGPGGGDPDRRHRDPRRAASGHDDAAGRLELVPAAVAGVAAPAALPGAGRRGDGDRAGAGRGLEAPANSPLGVRGPAGPRTRVGPALTTAG